MRQFRSDDTSVWPDRFGTGADGALTVASNSTYDGARASCSGTSGATALVLSAASTFANGDLVMIHQTRGTGAGNWELNKIASGGGTTSPTLAYTLQNTYTDSGASQAQIVELKQYSSVTINSGVTWSAPAWDGDTGGILAFVCDGTTTVTGLISASSKGFRGGLQVSGTDGAGRQGEGTGGDSGGFSTAANGNGGGGGATGSGFDGGAGGGGGGNGATGSTGGSGQQSSGGSGGNAAGTAGLTTMVLGGGGGSGSAGRNGANIGYAGGLGGGVVLIISKRITVTGSVVAAGGNGTNAGSGNGGAGGAGGGGSILYKGQRLTLGSTLTTAAGGSGGAAGGVAGSGGNGATGRIHADYSAVISGTTNPTIDTRQDTTLADQAGGAFLYLLV